MNKKYFFTLAATVFMSTCIIELFAQDYIDLASIYYRNTNENTYANTDKTTRVEEYGASLTFPVKLKSGNAIVTGMSFNNCNFTSGVTVKDEFISKDEFLLSSGVKLGMSVKHSEKISSLYLVLPKLAADVENIDFNDLQIGAVGLFTYKKSEILKYKFGLYYNTEKFGTYFVPLYGFYYQSVNKKFVVDVVFPSSIDFNYSLSDYLSVGGNFYGNTNSYNYGKDDEYYVHRSIKELTVYLQTALKKNFILQARVGHSIGRSIIKYKEDDDVSFAISPIYFGDNRTPLNDDFEDGLVFVLKLNYRFFLEAE